MTSMMFYPLQRQSTGNGFVEDSECRDMLSEVRRMQDKINSLKQMVDRKDAVIELLLRDVAAANAIGNIAHAEASRSSVVYEPYPGAFDEILGEELEQDREEYDRAPHPEWEPKR